jgi:D-lactate dehydrogenase
MKIAFFDAKPYDKIAFDKFCAENDIKIKYFETKLNEDTVNLAKGYDGVCVFVNDTVDKIVIDCLVELGVKVILLRCAGFNNVDIKHAKDKIKVVRVPAYSPYAVAEHTIALLLTSIRRIHKAYIRSRDYNFSLSGLTGFDLHGKTIGVIGTGRIGKAFIDICKGFGMNVLAYDKLSSVLDSTHIPNHALGNLNSAKQQNIVANGSKARCRVAFWTQFMYNCAKGGCSYGSNIHDRNTYCGCPASA